MCNFTIIHDNSSHSPSRMSNAELFGIFKKAAKLTKDPCNGCRIVVSERHFALSPRYLGRLKKGVMETLESEIGRYSESFLKDQRGRSGGTAGGSFKQQSLSAIAEAEVLQEKRPMTKAMKVLGGVPLAYCNLQLLQQTGNILDDHPFIHFNVSFKAVIFQPTIGSVLKCVVNELGQDHISCLVHNWFNLSLPLRGADAEERLPKGSKVIAKVTKIQAKNGILAIQGTPTEERFSDLPLVDPLKEDLSGDEGAHTTEIDGAIPKKEKHDSGFVSDPDNSIGLPLESTSEDDGGSVRKKKKKKEKREAEREQKMDDIIVKKEPILEETMEERLVGVTEGDGREGKKKKKKKDKVKEREMDDSPGMISIKKEPEWSPEEIDNMAAGDGSNVEQSTEKRKKKKRKSMIESDSPIQECIAVKTEKGDSEESSQDVNHSSKKKKKKKHKETDSEGLVVNAIKEEEKSTCKIMIKEEIDSHNEEIIEKKSKSKKHKHKDSHQVYETDSVGENQKHLKRKHSDIFKVNGGGDHDERTTQNEVYGTDEDSGAAPPKKKKRKHIKEEVVC